MKLSEINWELIMKAASAIFFFALLAGCGPSNMSIATLASPIFTLTPSYSPSATDTPSQTPTETAAPTITPVPTLAVDPSWKLVFFDPFDDDRNKWTQTKNGTIVQDDTIWKINIIDGVYRLIAITNHTTGNVFYPFLPVMNDVQDFYYAIDIKIVSASEGDVAALIFRLTDPMVKDSYYTFETKEPDWFRVKKYIPGPILGPILVNWTETPYIKNGSINHFAVLGIGSLYRFYVNGICVAHADDDSDPYMSGIVGVFARLQNQGDQMNVEFDNAEMSIPTGFGKITCP